MLHGHRHRRIEINRLGFTAGYEETHERGRDQQSQPPRICQETLHFSHLYSFPDECRISPAQLHLPSRSKETVGC
jgi:hypothetical protein